MKLRSVYVSTGAIIALMAFAVVRSHAATPAPLSNAGVSQSPGLQNVAWEEAKAEKLRHAYHILAHGDHDYRGHRVAAMHQIEAAAKILGVDLHGGGHGGEKQALSDVQLHDAKHTLESIVEDTHGKEHEHIRKAIENIDSALAIR